MKNLLMFIGGIVIGNLITAVILFKWGVAILEGMG